MTQRQHNTRVALRRSIAVHGAESNETRLAAIEFCYAHNIDPHWRRAVYPEFSAPPSKWDTPMEPNVVSAVHQWEDVIAKFMNDRTQ